MKRKTRLAITITTLGIGLAAAAVTSEKTTARASYVPDVEYGRVVFEANCIACHGAGIGNPGLAYKPGTDALRVKYNGQEPPVLSDRKDLSPEFIAYVVRNGVTLMPFFRKTDISDADLAALSAYLTRNNAKK